MSSKGTVVKVSGPLVIAEGLQGARMFEMCRVGNLGLFGEIIEIRGDQYSIQVYEETEGITPGEPVEGTGQSLSVHLGPGCLESIYDGVQRPLETLRRLTGDFLARGADAPALDLEKRWEFEATAKVGALLEGGDTLGWVQESPLIRHRIMVPPLMRGELVELRAGTYNVTETIGLLRNEQGDQPLMLAHKWPVRKPRPVTRRYSPDEPLVTGQRVIDTFFPLTKGGTACVPGPFGSGKTVVQHQLAKWSNAQIVVFVGCGERGNEMTDVLLEFPELIDPGSNRPLMERTILVANTSNMPVAAREASVFTGITLAEYYRDMGYDVALMADSTSRWAEAMREMSGRLEEMPGEEGYPAYLASRLAGFYERSGRVLTRGDKDSGGRVGSLSVIGAVSPPGGDLSEPVVQGTLRVVKVFWSLEDRLAFQRHFPAIGWLSSYSLYQDEVDGWADQNVSDTWSKNRRRAMALLKRESELEELVRLIGMDALAASDRLLMEGARMIREDFLHQSAFEPLDAYSTLKKQALLIDLVLAVYDAFEAARSKGARIEKLLALPIREEVSRAKLIPEDELERFESLKNLVREAAEQVARESAA